MKYAIGGIAVIVAAMALLFSGSHAQLQESIVVVDPRLDALLAQDDWVEALVSLRNPDMPMEQWTQDIQRQNAEERQDTVLDDLTSDDFRVIERFELASALAGSVSRSGLAKLADHPDVVAIGAADAGSPGLAQTVPLINADDVHTVGYDGTGVNVAVLDTGIDTDHPALSSSIVGEMCFPAYITCGPPAHPAEDLDGHGTRVSGVIASNGSGGVPVGVAAGVGIFAYRVMTSTVANANAVLAALQDIQSRGFLVDFVNMSFGAGLYPGVCSGVFPAIETQIGVNRLFGDILAFSISHNNGNKSNITWPACHASVVSVGAVYDANIGSYTWSGVCTDSSTIPNRVGCWSNSSGVLQLLAPGCNMTTSQVGGGTTSTCGTSLAAPVAVGVAALIKDANPSLTSNNVEERLSAAGRWTYDLVGARWTPRVDARVATLTNDNADYDGDGCRNGAEYTMNVPSSSYSGGIRNPLDSEDYYDVSIPRDGVIDLANDTLGVINHYSPGGGPPYDVNFDRGPIHASGPNFYNHGPRDGVIDLSNDLYSVIQQYNPTGSGC